LVRNELISNMGGQGSRYLLKLKVEEKTQAVSSVANSVVDRHRYRLNVAYTLVNAGTGEEIASGKSFSNVSYDTVEEPVADLQAAENARERAARELSQDLKIRLSAFFATRSS
jgi:LPS-assembly lipoprotein